MQKLLSKFYDLSWNCLLTLIWRLLVGERGKELAPLSPPRSLNNVSVTFVRLDVVGKLFWKSNLYFHEYFMGRYVVHFGGYY